MKKLNRKGFTLIELLAIIVILAIIMVVTLPTMLDSMSSAKTGQLSNAAASVQDWIKKQETLIAMGKDASGEWLASDSYKTFLGATAANPFNPSTHKLTSTAKTLTAAALEDAGIADPDTNIDLTGSTVKLNGTKICVVLKAKVGGSFYVAGDDTRSVGC